MNASWLFLTFANWWTVLQIFTCLLLIIISARYLSRAHPKVPFLSPSDEYVLVTGCDSGIGQEAAKLLDSLGFNVFAGCLFPSSQGATQLRTNASDKLRIVPLDITDETSVNSCLSLIDVQTEGKGLWSLVNNAGVLCYGYFDWLTWNQCQKQIDVNLLGTVRITHAFLPLIQKRQGRILTITSVNGLLAYPALSVYCATKFALEGFCDSLRLEQRRHNVTVIAIQLGDFAKLTSIFSNHKRDAQDMWNGMSAEKRERLGESFWQFHRDADEKCGTLSPLSFHDSPLRSVLVRATTSEQPAGRYLCMPQLQAAVLRLLLLCPKSFVDFLLSRAFSTDS